MTWNVKADGYFVAVPEWLDQAGVSDKAFRLYFRLNRLAMKDSGELPGRLEIAEMMGWSERTADRVLAELEDAQALDVLRQKDPTTGRYYPSEYMVRTARPVANPDVWTDQGKQPKPLVSPVANPGNRSDQGKAAKPLVSPVATGGDTSSREQEEEGTRAAPDPSPSSRRSRTHARANTRDDAGLTPSPAHPPVAAPPPPIDPARAMADRIAASGNAVTQVRRMVPVLRAYLDRGVDPERLERAAASLYSITEGTLGVALQREDERAERVKPVLKPRPGPPPPPLFVPKPRAEKSPEEKERIRAMNAERRAKAARAKAGVS